MIQLLENLVSIPSIVGEEQALADYIANLVQGMGCRVERVFSGERVNLVITSMEAESYLGFCTHLDTVPPAEDYAVDPYRLIVAGDLASGLGVSDSKGGIAVLLKTLELAVQYQLPMKVILVVDQENMSRGAYDVIDSGLVKDVDYLIFPETGHQVDFSKSYTVVNSRNGRLVYELNFFGETDGPKGSFVKRISEFVLALKEFEAALGQEVGSGIVIVESLKAEKISNELHSKCYLRCTLVTSSNFGSLEFESWLKNYSHRHQLVLEYKLADRITPYLKPYSSDTSNWFYRSLSEQFFIPDGVIPSNTPSVSDENVFAAFGIPVLTIGPIGGDGHTGGEWVNIESLEVVTKLYQSALSIFSEQVSKKDLKTLKIAAGGE